MSFFSALMDFLHSIAFYVPYIAGGFVLIAIAVLGVLLATVWRGNQAGRALVARAGAFGIDEEEAEPVDLRDGFLSDREEMPTLPLRQSFRRAIHLLRDHVNTRDYKYAIPWYLLIGPDGGGASALAASADLNLPLGRPEDDWGEGDLKWWFFDRGVVLDVPGNYVRPRDPSQRRAGSSAWSTLLSQLEAYRPKRPLDGIVVAIPIDDLVDFDGRALPSDIMRRNAEPLYKRLWEAQTRTGLSVPIYVVLTKGELLPGFEPFVQALPSQAAKDMFGWSNPNGFDVQYKDAWVQTALNALSDTALNAQLAICAEKRNVLGVEQTQRLPGAIAGLSDPLTQYLHHIFKPSAFHEGFALRGIFLTGAGAQDESHSAIAHSRAYSDPYAYSGPDPYFGTSRLGARNGAGEGHLTEGHSIAFVHDLFSRKVFPESGLARPVRRTVLNRNRRVSAAQGASVAILAFGALGLIYSSISLREEIATVTPFVEDVGRTLSDMQATRTGSGAATSLGAAMGPGAFNREDALLLLRDMTGLNTDSLWALWIPSSWFSDLDDDVIEYAVHAYNEIILKSMRAGLITQGRLLAEGRLPEAHLSASHTQNDTRVSQNFGEATERLRQFVQAVRLYESEIERFNTLKERGRAQDISELVEYLFGVILPESFEAHSGFYTRALEQIDRRDLDILPLRDAVSAAASDLGRDSAADVFQTSPLVLRLQSVAARLDQGVTGRGDTTTAIEEIRRDIDLLSEMLANPRYDWLHNQDYNPTAAFAETIEQIAGSRLLGPEVATDYALAVETGLTSARRIAEQIGSFALGPLLDTRDGGAHAKLSDGVVALKAVLDSLFAKPFMEENRVTGLPSPAALTTPVFWNEPILADAVALVDEFDRFVRDELLLAPRALHPLIVASAAARLEQNANSLIAQAYFTRRGGRGAAGGARGGVGREDLIQREVEDLARATEALTSLIQFYEEVGLDSSALSLRDLTAFHSYGLLETTDDLFASEPFYEPRDASFSSWTGQENLALLAFGMRDEAGLRALLASYRERIILLATNYAAPALSFLGNSASLPSSGPFSGGELDLIRKWQGISEEAQKFVLRKADNNISALESFILNDMASVRVNTCAEGFANRGPLSPLLEFEADYFLEQQRFLTAQLEARCRLITGDEAIGAYNTIAEAFAGTLQGRYPFARGPYQTDQPEVTIRDIQRFFAVFDANRETAENALNSAALFGPDRQLAQAFLKQLDQTRTFFAGILETGRANAQAVYTVNIDFRVNRDREVDANQVIEWRAAIGSGETTLRRADQSLRWSLGDPIRLSFRWADGATQVPVASGASGGASGGALRVNDLTTSLDYNNLWSLLDLIRRHSAGAEDFQDLADPQPHTLRFDVPTRPPQGGQISMSRLFIRARLTALVEGAAVTMTVPVFPVSAPSLGR